MRRLTRYVLVEFLKVFLVTLVGMTALIVIGLVLVEAIRGGLDPLSALRLLPFTVPMALPYAIPGTTLFAVCSIFGRMSAANELIALKAAGISPMSLIWPALFVSLLLSMVVVWLNDLAVSWGRPGMNRVFLESVEPIVYSMLRSHKTYSSPGISISVRGVDGRKLLNPTVTVRSNNGPTWNIMAEEAELRCDPVAETLTILVRDCEIDWGKMRGNYPGVVPLMIPLSSATRRGSESSRPADTELRRIPKEILAQSEQLKQLEKSVAAEAALQMLTGDLGELTGEDWSARNSQMQVGTARLHRLKTEPWRRSANGFSCFFFTLVGAPLAVRLRTGDVWTSFAICFLPILIVYYPLLMYGADLAKSGQLPPYCVWMGNAVMSLIGYSLIRRVLRY